MAQAYIQEIQKKETAAGIMYDFVFSDGNKVGAGKFPPKGFGPGDYVNYDITMRGQYTNLKPGSMSKATPPAGVAAPAAQQTSAATSGYAKPNGNAGGYDRRQEIISKQAALNSGLTFVNLLVSADALPIPKTAKSDKKADLMEEIVMRYTAQFYNLATGEDYPLPDTMPAGLEAAEDGGNWDE